MVSVLALIVGFDAMFVGVHSALLADVKRLRDDIFTDYDKDFLPLLNFDNSAQVTIDASVITLNDFNDISGEVSMTTVLNFQWTEQRIKWHPRDYNGMNHLFVPFTDLWRPHVVVQNAAGKVEDLGKDSIVLRLGHDGTVKWVFGQVLRFTCSVNVKYYPFDTQTCFLSITSWAFSNTDVKLSAKSSVLNTDFYSDNSQWILVPLNTSMPYDGGIKTLIQYAFQLKRRSQFFVIYIFCPIILLSILNYLVFAMPISTGERMGVAITSYLSYAVYMGIINEHVPENSDSIPIVFIYLLLLLCHSSLVMILAVISARIHEKDGHVFKWVQLIVKTLKFQNCHQQQRKISPQKRSAGDVSDVQTESMDIIADDDTIEEMKKNPEEFTWQDVGKLFDAYVFFLIIVLHFSLAVGFLYSLSINDIAI